MPANVELTTFTRNIVYRDEADAVNHWRIKNGGLSKKEEILLQDFLKQNLRKADNGEMILPDHHMRWAVIWWEKEKNQLQTGATL